MTELGHTRKLSDSGYIDSPPVGEGLDRQFPWIRHFDTPKEKSEPSVTKANESKRSAGPYGIRRILRTLLVNYGNENVSAEEDVSRKKDVSRKEDISEISFVAGKEHLKLNSIGLDAVHLNERDFQSILKHAEPDLPEKAIEALDKINQYLHMEKDELPHAEYIAQVKEAIKAVSPETWSDYVDKGIGVAVNPDDQFTYPKGRENRDNGKWEFLLSINYKHQKGLTLRAIDAISVISAKKTDPAEVTPDAVWRAEILCRACLANRRLGKKYGWPTDDYPLAKKYDQYYQDGLRDAWKRGYINDQTTKEDLIQVGHSYARQKFIDMVLQLKKDIPPVFYSIMPGSYFEEVARFAHMKRLIQPNEDSSSARRVERLRVGTEDFARLVDDLDTRLETRNIEKSLKVVIRPNKEIWALPYHFEGKEKSQHSIVGDGDLSVWSGEVVLEGLKKTSSPTSRRKVLCVRNDSGHYRTQGDAISEKQRIRFLKEAFEAQGYDTSEMQVIEPGKNGAERFASFANGLEGEAQDKIWR